MGDEFGMRELREVGAKGERREGRDIPKEEMRGE